MSDAPTDPRWDAALWSASSMAEACMKLGGVVLERPPRQPTGFGPTGPPKPK